MPVLDSTVNTDSNINTKNRQVDAQFASIVSEIVKTGKVPSTYSGDIGQLKPYLDAIIEALDADGRDAVLPAFRALAAKYPRLQKAYATVYATTETSQTPAAEQEENADPRLKLGKHGKLVFVTLSMSELKQLPRVDWLIPKIWQKVGTSLTYGDANTGKTFVDLDIALHHAYGMEWQGHNLKQGQVLYIFGEGNEGLVSRVEAWQHHHNKPDTSHIQFICFPVQLMSERELLCATIEDQDQVPSLIVIDTFSVCAEGVSENDNVEVARYIAAASYIKRTYKTHVHIIHHAGKNGDYRGAAAFRGNIDTMALLSRENEQSPIVMSCKKQKDAEYFPDIRLELKQIELGLDIDTLEPITSCVVIASDTPATEKASSQTEQKMLEILALQGRTSYNAWKKACEDAKVVKATSFYTHVQALLAQGGVKKDSEGRGKRTWYEVPEETSSTSSETSSVN